MSAGEHTDAIVAVRDGAAYLEQAIESILAQTRPPERIVVVDDGSTDDTALRAERYGPPVVVLRQPARGTPAALNAGLAASDAPLVAFLDADDLWTERKLELQLGLLEREPDVEAVYGHVSEFLDGDAERLVPRAGAVAGIAKSTLLVRRATLDRVGLFDESYAVVDFPEWYSRSRAAGVSERLLPDVLALRRLHGGNVTLKRRDTTHAEYLRLARAAVERRRSVTGSA